MSSGLIRSPYYRVAAKAIIKDDQDRLLVFETTEHTYELPGGGWEHDEASLQDCMRREIKEELGVDTKDVGLPLFLIKGLHTNGNWKVSLLIPVTLTSTEFDLSNEPDLLRAIYVTRKEMPALNFGSDEKPILDHLDELWPSKH